MKIIKNLAVLGALGLLAACGGNSGSVTLPRQTPLPPGPGPQPPANSQFTQIERLSRPAIKEVFETFVQHQTSNATEPYNDPTIKGAIKGTEDALRPPNANAGTDYGATLTTILYPDEYTVDLTQTTAAYLGAETGGATGGKFGGRKPTDDVIGISLGALFGNTLSALKVTADDGEENNCISKQNLTQNASQVPTTTFPYLAQAH